MSYSQGLSGLNAASSQLSVIGNNVANANTVGFKGSEAQFSDAFANALAGGNSTAIGIGVQLQTVAQQFAQGNITATNSALDLAINGGRIFSIVKCTRHNL
ncbi:MAG: flagellar hook-basal body complex protein [Nitrosomonadales bacterium]